MVNNFKQLGINKDLVKGLTELSIITPTEIQVEAIPLLLNDRTELVAKAQTGTGKTAAYCLPLLQKIDTKNKVVQGLILCPTRELGQQIAKQLFKFTKYTENVFTECVYGGARLDEQLRALKRPTHIIVATPGRLLDLVERKAIKLSQVHTVILDEADEMLSMGFKKELDEILSLCRAVENKWLFSATMPHTLNQIINTHLAPNASRIAIKGKSGVNKNVDHQFLICDVPEKLPILLQFLKTQQKSQGIVFCKTKNTAKTLVKQLIAKNISADTLHGDLLQKERDKAMRNFTKNNLQVLVATDIAARGIDIPDLAYVVHYEMPSSDEYYTHRSGRTGRGGKSGVSIALVTTKETKQVRILEKKLGVSFSQIRRMKS
ncbi:MAG: DEAD/DEAH box helicase [Crocinitomix sp.]|nr:DEAD/DEAH box helicase [Crocinitomix sp.]